MIESSNRTYSITEAANLCGINRITLWRWIKSGKLQAHRTPTGLFIIKQEDLENFIRKDLTHLDINLTGSNETILIVDDDNSFRRLLKEILERTNYRTEEAKNAFEAGLKIMKYKPALLILDLYMPEMDGFEMCRIIKEEPNTSDIKILAVTGYATPEVKKRIIEYGADAFMEKPFKKETLIDNVDQLLLTNEYAINRAY